MIRRNYEYYFVFDVFDGNYRCYKCYWIVVGVGWFFWWGVVLGWLCYICRKCGYVDYWCGM